MQKIKLKNEDKISELYKFMILFLEKYSPEPDNNIYTYFSFDEMKKHNINYNSSIFKEYEIFKTIDDEEKEIIVYNDNLFLIESFDDETLNDKLKNMKVLYMIQDYIDGHYDLEEMINKFGENEKEIYKIITKNKFLLKEYFKDSDINEIIKKIKI